MRIKNHPDFVNVWAMFHAINYAPDGYLAFELWRWSNAFDSCGALVISVFEVLGFVPHKGFPLVREKCGPKSPTAEVLQRYNAIMGGVNGVFDLEMLKSHMLVKGFTHVASAAGPIEIWNFRPFGDGAFSESWNCKVTKFNEATDYYENQTPVVLGVWRFIKPHTFFDAEAVISHAKSKGQPIHREDVVIATPGRFKLIVKGATRRHFNPASGLGEYIGPEAERATKLSEIFRYSNVTV